VSIAARDIRRVLVERGGPGYEKARARATGRNGGAYRPEVIVQAACAEEVRAAVALARADRLKVAVRAEGYGWGGAPLGDGGMLIDLSGLRRCRVEDGTATVQPGVTCADLTRALADRAHAFPAAHRGTATLSGFVLGGGLGWNSRAWGPACASVAAIEAVTATGDTVRCDDQENPDLLWAARGGGPGFFAAVTSFRLRLRHLPPAIMTTRYAFPLADVEDVAYWCDEVAAALPANVELTVVLATAEDGAAKVVVVTATAFSCAWDDAIRCLEPLRGCPYAGRALLRQVDRPTPFTVLFSGSDAVWPPGRRTATDSLWLNAGFAALLPALVRPMETAPSPESIIVVEPAPGGPAFSPAMAFSPLGRIRLGCYAMWADRSADEPNLAWLRGLTADAEPQAAGRYVAEADLSGEPCRARRSFTPAAWARFQDLRVRYDPDGVFESYPQP
jgi:FAD/FMN-containing dehydrogenase